VEARSGAEGKPCFTLSDPTDSELKSHEPKSLTFSMTNLPSSSQLRLRLSMFAVKELRGVEGFLLRVRLKLVEKEDLILLNPFNKSTEVGGQAFSLQSSEFVNP